MVLTVGGFCTKSSTKKGLKEGEMEGGAVMGHKCSAPVVIGWGKGAGEGESAGGHGAPGTSKGRRRGRAARLSAAGLSQGLPGGESGGEGRLGPKRSRLARRLGPALREGAGPRQRERREEEANWAGRKGFGPKEIFLIFKAFSNRISTHFQKRF